MVMVWGQYVRSAVPGTHLWVHHLVDRQDDRKSKVNLDYTMKACLSKANEQTHPALPGSSGDFIGWE